MSRRNTLLRISLKSTDGLYMQTVNPCNDFLIDFLIASKLKNEKQNMGKHTTYNLAIQSVRKYPLPIICEAQLAALQGFGEFFINEAAKRIQKHYRRGRLPTPQEIEEDDQEHFAAMIANRRKGYKRRQAPVPQEEIVEFEGAEDSQQQKKQEFGSEINEKQTSQNNSKTSVGKKNFVPKPETEPFLILMALYELNAKQNLSVCKIQINEVLHNWRRTYVLSWLTNRQKLLDAHYIKIDAREKDKIKLTHKGVQFVLQNMKNSELCEEKFMKKMSEDIVKNKIQSFVTNKGSNQQFMIDCRHPQEQVTILISSNQKLDQIQKERIHFRLVEEEHHKISMKQQLIYSSFMWKVDQKLLDYAVVRLKMNPYKINKQRLVERCNLSRLSEIATKIYIVVEKSKKQQIDEYYTIGNKDKEDIQFKNLQEYRTLLANARAYGFNIVVTRSFDETLHFVSEHTKALKQKLKSLKKTNEKMKVLGFVEVYNKKVQQKNWNGCTFTQCMSVIPGITKNMALLLAKKFGVFLRLKQKLDRSQSEQKRFRILQYLLQDYGVSSESIQIILDIIYKQSYSQNQNQNQIRSQ